MRKAANFKTTKAALRLADEYNNLSGSRELLGLKVVAFVNTTPNKTIPLPKTVVVGNKVTNAKAVVDAGWTGGDLRIAEERINSLTVNDVIFSHRTPSDILRTDIIRREPIYAFFSDGSGVARPIDGPNARPTDRFHPDVNNVNYLLGTVARNGAYTIDYIDNGLNSDGSLNHAILFTPFEAIYISSDASDQWTNQTGNGKGGAAISRIASRNRIIDSVTYANSSLANGNAYFISRQGEYIVRHGDPLTLLSDNASVSYISEDRSTIRLSRTVAWLSSAEIQINYNSRDVFYKALKNRSNSGVGFTAKGANNDYDITLQDQYRVYSVSSINPNYGYVGANSGEFVIFNRRTNPIDPRKHYAYILSTNNSQQLNPGGTLTRIYTVYDLTSRTHKEIYDVQQTITPYSQGSYIVYANQGTHSHRITGAVDPFAVTCRQGLEHGALIDAWDALDTYNLGLIADTVFDETSVIGSAFLNPINFAMLQNGLSLGAVTPITNFAAINTLFSDLTGVAAGYTAFAVTPAIPTDASPGVIIAAEDFYGIADRAAWLGLMDTTISTAISNILAASDIGTNMVGLIYSPNMTAINANRTIIADAIIDTKVLLRLLEQKLDIVYDARATEIESGLSTVVTKNNGLIIKACEAYLSAFKTIIDEIDATADGLITLVNDLRTQASAFNTRVLDPSTRVDRNEQLTPTSNPFVEANELGWIATNLKFGVNSSVDATHSTGAFHGFYYEPATKTSYVGRQGRNVDASDFFIRATIQPNTHILLTDGATRYSLITRDQLDAFILSLAGERSAIVSAMVIRDNNATANNGTAKLLALVVDPANSIANSYLSQKNYATEELIITAIKSELMNIDGVNYFLVSAYDYASKSSIDVIVSAVNPLYSEVLVGSRVYLSSVNVTIPGTTTTYRVAQLIERPGDVTNILSYDYLTKMIANKDQIAVNYEPGIGVTVSSGKSYPAYDTSNIAFINLTLYKNAAGTVTAYEINNAAWKLRIGQTNTDRASGFSTPGYMWEGFNSIRRSGYLNNVLPDLANFPRLSTTVDGVTYASGTWYFAPVNVVNPVGGITLIYVDSIITR